MKLDEIQSKLLDKNIIDISGEIDSDMAYYIRECLRRLVANGSPDIIVTITSHGGIISISLDIYDMLRLYPGKKIGKVIAHADSMATVILQACDIRQCARHATMLIHFIDTRISFDKMINLKKIKKVVSKTNDSQVLIDSILSRRTGNKVSTIRRTYLKEKDMSAKEAKEFGLIDEII